jgi:N-methylhydantoinase B
MTSLVNQAVEKEESVATDDADPTTTEIVRQALYSAANQMKRALVRTAFSPTIYDAQDFAVALYDRRVQMLAQSPTLPAFMGTLSFCVEAAVKAVGGEGSLEPGDLLIYNVPYGSGSHAQDVAIVAPVFYGERRLIGYAVSKAHQVDIGAQSTYCTNTTDVFQEGVLFPGVKLHRAGLRVEDVYRIALANSRVPEAMVGDLHAQEVCARIGCDALVRIVDRFGLDNFERAIEHMFVQSERVVRGFLQRIPQGRYVGRSYLDNDGVDPGPVEIEVAVEVRDSTVTVDFTNAPAVRRGPINCPYPSTVSASRVAIMMLAGGGDEPNEGHFRALRVLTRENSMYHPLSPAPCYLYGWAIDQAVEAIFLAFAEGAPGLAPAGSAADLVAVGGWTRNQKTGELFHFGPALPVGHGGRPDGDGHVVFIAPLSNSRIPSAELTEAKSPIRYVRWEFVPDSFGVGRFRGGPAWDHDWVLLQDGAIISTIDRTIEPSRGILGGGSGLPNRFVLESPDGSRRECGRATDVPVKAGTIFRVRCGGGGGYGPAHERAASAVHADLADGLMTEAFARKHFPHAFVAAGKE